MNVDAAYVQTLRIARVLVEPPRFFDRNPELGFFVAGRRVVMLSRCFYVRIDAQCDRGGLVHRLAEIAELAQLAFAFDIEAVDTCCERSRQLNDGFAYSAENNALGGNACEERTVQFAATNYVCARAFAA